MSKYKIALLDGDGIGPEIMVEAVKVLKLVEQRNDVEFELIHAPFGASAYFECGDPFPEQTKKIWELYDSVAADVGYVGGPENRGYLIQVHVSDNEEKAIENARQFRWMQGEFTGLAHPVWSTPSGYGSPSARRAFVEFASGRASNPRGQTVYWIGAAGEAQNSLYSIDFKQPLAIVMGSEGKGLRRLTREHCDYLMSIPMAGALSSLNVSVATGLCLFEAVRQRRK